jgi:hypothetical protein
MGSKLRLWLVFGFIMLGVTGKAFAFDWHVTPSVPLTSADTAQLPLYVTFDVYGPAGWTGVTGTTWQHIWPRSGNGSWYRPNPYTQPTLRRDPVYPYPYTCSVQSYNSFRCRDIVRGIDRTITCPNTATIGPMVKWRSKYDGVNKHLGLFWASTGPFSCDAPRAIAFSYASVTGNGQQINCSYNTLTSQGPNIWMDRYCWRR